MGMAEKIDDLYLLDFVLKDRDRFLIVFSGMSNNIQASSMLEMPTKNRDNQFKTISNLVNCPSK